MHSVTTALESADQVQMCETRKRCLEPEINRSFRKEVNFSKHQSTRTKRYGFRRKGRHLLRDQICVDEILAIGVIRQEFPSK